MLEECNDLNYFMSWQEFLKSVCSNPEYQLTLLEQEVLLCLDLEQAPSKSQLLKSYQEFYAPVEPEAFTQRLKNIYRKFEITSKGHKLPQLHKYLINQYADYQSKNLFFSQIGISHVYPRFPRDRFSRALITVINSDLEAEKRVNILQTFAPNLNDYYEQLAECLQNQVKVRILLAWPYSQAARIRESVLRKYADRDSANGVNIFHEVVANLETIERVIQVVGTSPLLEVRLYDTLPSLAIYRAGNYVLAAPFLHGSLAVNNFQLELNLNTPDSLITKTLQQDFKLMWQVARSFIPDPQRNWRNDLKILFTD